MQQMPLEPVAIASCCPIAACTQRGTLPRIRSCDRTTVVIGRSRLHQANDEGLWRTQSGLNRTPALHLSKVRGEIIPTQNGPCGTSCIYIRRLRSHRLISFFSSSHLKLQHRYCATPLPNWGLYPAFGQPLSRDPLAPNRKARSAAGRAFA
jgi:hypothetical protein